MAKRSKRNAETDAADIDDDSFAISKHRMGKPELVVTAVNFTREQNDHLAAVCQENETSRAEFVRQAVAFCLKKMGNPFPD